MTCHLFLDNFFEISWPLCCFQRLRVLKLIFVSRKLKYLEFDIMKCSSFLNSVFRKRRFITENWLCFRACNSRIVTYDQEFCPVVWFCILITCYGIFSFEKFSFRKSWCCRKHVFVFEIVSLKSLNEFYDQIIFFPVTFWVKDFSSPLWKKFWKLFRFGRWLSFCSRKLNFGIWEGDLWVGAPRKVLMCSLFLDTS